MEEFLHCKICHDLYDRTSKRPLILPCGHTICEYCLKIILKSNQVKCPFDKKIHAFSTIHEIVNHQMNDFFLLEKNENKESKCLSHPNQFLKFYCKTEKVAICQICYLDSHLTKEHDVIALKEVISLENMAQKINSLKENSLNSLELCKATSMEIEESFNEFKKNFSDMKEKLLNEISFQSNEILSQKKQEINEKENELEMSQKEIKKMEEETTRNLNELEEFKGEEYQMPSKRLQELIEKSKYNPPKSLSKKTKKENSKNDPDMVLPLLIPKNRDIYLKIQNPNYNSHNSKMIKKLKESIEFENEEIIATFFIVNRCNYIDKKNEKSVVDIYKSIKFTINYSLSSPIKIAKLLNELLKSKQKKDLQVLEIGCGCGYTTACLANMIGKKGKLITIENSEAFLKKAQENIKNFNPELSDRIEFQFKSYDSLEFPPNQKFDIIYISTPMQNFPIYYEEMMALNGVMWTSVGSSISGNISNYIFEKDKKGEVRTRKVEIP